MAMVEVDGRITISTNPVRVSIAIRHMQWTLDILHNV